MANVWLMHEGAKRMKHTPIKSFIPREFTKNPKQGYLYRCCKPIIRATDVIDEHGCIGSFSDSGYKVDNIVSSKFKSGFKDNGLIENHIFNEYNLNISPKNVMYSREFRFINPVVLKSDSKIILGEMSEVLEWHKKQRNATYDNSIYACVGAIFGFICGISFLRI